YKGGNMLHFIRQVVNNDEKWRGILRGLQSKFRHQTVSGAQVQSYMSQQAGIDLAPIFAQYLYTTRVPVFEYKKDATGFAYRWNNVVPGFNAPVKVSVDGGAEIWLKPTGLWQTQVGSYRPDVNVVVDNNWYVLTQKY
ncbi:MAG: M1 family peptidase, partial [Gemmatimonadaceae bacterium]